MMKFEGCSCADNGSKFAIYLADVVMVRPVTIGVYSFFNTAAIILTPNA